MLATANMSATALMDCIALTGHGTPEKILASTFGESSDLAARCDCCGLCEELIIIFNQPAVRDCSPVLHHASGTSISGSVFLCCCENAKRVYQPQQLIPVCAFILAVKMRRAQVQSGRRLSFGLPYNCRWRP